MDSTVQSPMKLALSITDFCKSHGISRSLYYELQRSGEGPAELRVRGRVLISVEAARAWRLGKAAA